MAPLVSVSPPREMAQRRASTGPSSSARRWAAAAMAQARRHQPMFSVGAAGRSAGRRGSSGGTGVPATRSARTEAAAAFTSAAAAEGWVRTAKARPAAAASSGRPAQAGPAAARAMRLPLPWTASSGPGAAPRVQARAALDVAAPMSGGPLRAQATRRSV